VGKNFRGQGLFDRSYDAYKQFFQGNYEFAITEIATINLRSMKAHERIGFKTIYTYADSTNTDWNVVVWDWR